MIRKGISGLRHDRRGSAAVEFALVTPLFLALVFSILEAGWYFFVNASVEEANALAARLIRTGQAQDGGVSRDEFYNKICDVVDTFGDCSETLTIDIASFKSFGALASDLSKPQCRNKADPAIKGVQFDETDYGGQRDIVRVRVCFLYRPVNPALGLSLGQAPDGRRKVISVSIFRNEPFKS